MPKDSEILKPLQDRDSLKEKKSSKEERIDFFENIKPIDSSKWNMSEEAITKELEEIKKTKASEEKTSKDSTETKEDENLSAVGSLKYKQ